MFLEKIFMYKQNETSGETQTYMSELFRQRRTKEKSFLFFWFVRDCLKCLFLKGVDGINKPLEGA